jgi:serine/threonine-protein kinase
MIQPPSRRTAVLPPPPPPVYYDLEEPIHRRPVWPWFAALFFVCVAGIGGYLLYSQISHKLASNNPVGVENYLNMTEALARQKIRADGFAPVVNHHASRTVLDGQVFKQDPAPGTRRVKGSPVTIWVSTGLPKVVVPSLAGETQDAAVAQLTRLGLKAKVLQVPSNKPAGQVLVQDPPSDTKVQVGTVVHFNVSKGPQPVAVPDVRGEPIDQASSTLQADGFKVATTFVESSQPANTVIDMSPPAGSSAGKGSIISLTVSKGPKTSTVPDVSSLDVGTATATLANSGFKPKVLYQDVTDPSLDGNVLSETPQGGTQAAPGSTVTITVGRLTQGQTTTTTDTTTTQ